MFQAAVITRHLYIIKAWAIGKVSSQHSLGSEPGLIGHSLGKISSFTELSRITQSRIKQVAMVSLWIYAQTFRASGASNNLSLPSDDGTINHHHAKLEQKI